MKKLLFAILLVLGFIVGYNHKKFENIKFNPTTYYRLEGVKKYYKINKWVEGIDPVTKMEFNIDIKPHDKIFHDVKKGETQYVTWKSNWFMQSFGLEVHLYDDEES